MATKTWGESTPKVEIVKTEDDANGYQKRITIGYKMATAADYGTTYMDKDPLSSFLSVNKPYTNIPAPSDFKKIISMSMNFYKTQFMYRAYVDLLMDFSIMKITNQCKDPKILAFYNKWNKMVGLDTVCKQLILDYYSVANAYTYKTMSAVTPTNEALKELTQGNNAKTATAAKKDKWTKKELPTSYTVLNPELVSVEGSLLGNNVMMTLEVPTNIKEMLKKAKTNKAYSFLFDNIDPALVKEMESKDAILLDSNKVGTLYDRKRPYERYAVPAVYTAFPAFVRYDMLRNMDVSTIAGFINQLITVTIGSDKFPATDKQLKKVAELFKNPSKSMTLFWNHTLEVTFHKPDITVLGSNKYDPVLEEMRTALRIPQVLLDGSGKTSFATAVIAAKPIVKRIYQALEDLKEQWIYPEYKAIADTMGFAEYPTVDFGENALEDEATKVKILTALRTHNLVSAKTAMEKYAGNNYEHEIAQMQAEKPLIDEGILGAGSPFNGGAGRPPLVPADYPTDRKSPPPKGKSAASVVKSTKNRDILDRSASQLQLQLLNKLSESAEEILPEDDDTI